MNHRNNKYKEVQTRKKKKHCVPQNAYHFNSKGSLEIRMSFCTWKGLALTNQALQQPVQKHHKG